MRLVDGIILENETQACPQCGWEMEYVDGRWYCVWCLYEEDED